MIIHCCCIKTPQPSLHKPHPSCTQRGFEDCRAPKAEAECSIYKYTFPPAQGVFVLQPEGAVCNHISAWLGPRGRGWGCSCSANVPWLQGHLVLQHPSPGIRWLQGFLPLPKGVKRFQLQRKCSISAPKADEVSSLPGLEGLLQASRV